MPKISIIIIHWNTPDLLKEQLAVLKKSDDVEIIIVDNFYSKDVAKQVSRHSKSATKIVLNSENEGFARAGNTGARLANGEWLLFLNPDVMISNDAVMSFIEHSEDRRLDAASPETSDDRYTKPVPSLSSLFVEFTPLRRVIPLSVFKKKTLTGGCLLIKKDVFEKIGEWDEKFFLWFEDSDLTKRLIDEGYSVGFVNVDVHHAGGASFAALDDSKRRALFFKSMNQYASKHFSSFGNRVVELLSKRFT